jgi:hypothetical protein
MAPMDPRPAQAARKASMSDERLATEASTGVWLPEQNRREGGIIKPS